MGKIHNRKDLLEQLTTRSLLAITLAASLAASGCTSNRNPGSGTPTRVTPELRTAPTSAITSGSETPTLPPPMTSSYTGTEALPRVERRRSIRMSANEAAALMAQHQVSRGRYLGVVNPGPSGRAYASDAQGVYMNPALVTNPQSTVNSSISSYPTAVISSEAGITSGVTTATGTTASAVVAGTTSGTTTTVTSDANVSPTSTVPGLASGTFAATRADLPTITAASSGFGRTLTSANSNPSLAPAFNTATNTGTTSAATAGGATATGETVASASVPVRIVRSASGTVTVTNVSATNTSTRTSSGRNQ